MDPHVPDATNMDSLAPDPIIQPAPEVMDPAVESNGTSGLPVPELVQDCTGQNHNGDVDKVGISKKPVLRTKRSRDSENQEDLQLSDSDSRDGLTEQNIANVENINKNISAAPVTYIQSAPEIYTDKVSSVDETGDSGASAPMETDQSVATGEAVESSPEGTENAATENPDGTPVVIPEVPAAEIIEKEPPELAKYWKAVKENPADFTGWTYLLQYVEQENKIKYAREANDEFFKYYPYCYGYWKKYADFEKKHGLLTKSDEVFERGVRAIPLSTDLWMHYIQYARSNWVGDDIDERIRSLHERAIAAAGTDFRSDKLWETIISWEMEKDNLKCVFQLYERLLRIPTQLYSHNFDNFKAFVTSHPPKTFLELDEFLNVRKEVMEMNPALSIDTRDEEVEDEGPPGDEAPPGTEESDEPKKMTYYKMIVTPQPDSAESTAVKEKIIEKREKVYKDTEEEVSKRWTFEENIRRPYFHVKPLEKAQLKNWKEYIDFEIENGSHERIVVLFERCLIACALYEEFWMKYAKYLEKHSVTAVRNVYRRACLIHLPKKPSIHLSWAAFEEKQGEKKESWQILNHLYKATPGLASLAMRRIGLERRNGNLEEVENLYKEYLQSATTRSVYNYFVIKYSRFVLKVLKDYDKARKVVLDALMQDELNAKLYMQLIDLEYQNPEANDETLFKIFDQALALDFPIETKVLLSRRRLEYAEESASDVSKVLEYYDEHQKIIKDLKFEEKKKQELQEEKEKRIVEHATASEAPPTKKARTEQDDATAAAAAAAAYQGTQGYGQNYDQSWGSWGYPQQQTSYAAGSWGHYNQQYY